MLSLPYDVVLLPDASLAQKAVKLSAHLAERGTYFALDDASHYPHLSLYMVQLNETGLAEALTLLESFAARTTGIEATADHYHYSHDYLDVEYLKSPELTDLQDAVVQMLNPLRDGLRDKDEERLATATGEELANITAYGYRNIGTLFAPHLTFTRFPSDCREVIKSLPSPDTFSGRFASLGIFKLGDHGTCIEPVATWKLL